MSELSEAAGQALRAAVSAEHTAVWVYGLASAFANESRVSSAIEEAMREHEQQRDSAEQLARAGGVDPPPPRPAYQLPEQVTDQTSAIRALLTAENDCQVGWRSVLENSEDPTLHRNAVAGLSTSAVRATRWRITIGQQPPVTPFPGQPG